MPDALLAAVADRYAAIGEDPRARWRKIARPDQILPAGAGWRITYYQGGRGSGKTRSGAQGLVDLILADSEGAGQWGICAPTYRDAWTVCVEGESGLLTALGTSMSEIKDGRSKYITSAYRSYGEVTLRNGHVIFVDSADDGALRIQGKNLKGIWCDEVGLWRRWAIAWDESIKYAVRRGASKIIATGTPKVSRPAAKLIRRLLRDEPGCIVRRLRTVDNLPNLSEAFFQAVVARAKGTRLERQELEGELLDDVENALWLRDLLDEIQVEQIPTKVTGSDGAELPALRTVYVGADPSDGTEDSDEQAYTVSGLGDDGLIYVAESFGARIGPVPFLRRAIQATWDWGGTLILEKNHGGAYLVETARQVMKDMIKEKKIGRMVPVRVVHASQAKRTRAEPVAALYERKLVRHAKGPHVELEDQMCSFTGAQGERSPDRLDSLVWSLTRFLAHTFEDTAPPVPRKYAAHQTLERIAAPVSEPGARRRLAQGRRRQAGWDLGSFAPQDPGEDRDAEYPDHPNVHSYR